MMDMALQLRMLGGGFLLAVVTFDLMFDPFPTEGCASYYRRVTRHPLRHTVAAAMLLAVSSTCFVATAGDQALWARAASCVFLMAPISLAAARTFPNAIRLGGRVPAETAEVLRQLILADHKMVVGSLCLFLCVSLFGPLA
jgi:hypothetical protein